MRNIYFAGYEVLRDAAPLGSLLPPGSELARLYEETSQRAMTLRDLLSMMASFERSMIDAARLAQRAAARGLFTQEDARIYDVLAQALFAMEHHTYRVIQKLLEDVPAIARQVPRPIALPTSAQLVGLRSRSQLPTAGLSGLGAVPAIVWAAAVLALLVAVAAAALTYAFTTGDVAAEEARQAIAIAEVIKGEWDSMIAARERAYDACVAQGGTPEDCARAARQLVPTPEEAGTVPQLLSPTGSAWSGFVLPALLLTAGVGAVVYFVSKRRKASSSSSDDADDLWSFDGLGGARRVTRLDGPSRYYLEVKKDAR